MISALTYLRVFFLRVVVELPENWTDTREIIVEGMTFNLRQLGTTLVDQPKGAELSAAAVKRIFATVRGKSVTRACDIHELS